jgi:hypothetical protein
MGSGIARQRSVQMHIVCECGYVIHDSSDYLPYKGYVVSDMDWFDFLETIDYAIEKSGPSVENKEKALMDVRSLAAKLFRSIYQCKNCGRLFISKEKGKLETFTMSTPFDGSEIFRSAYGDKEPLA